MGHLCEGTGYLTDGDISAAIECYERAITVSADPFYCQWPRFFLGGCYLLNGQCEEAENALREVLSFSQSFGCECIGTPAFGALGLVLIAKGQPAQGFKMAEAALQLFIENKKRPAAAMTEYFLGKTYFQIFEKARPLSLAKLFKIDWSVVKNILFARKKAHYHLTRALEVAKEIGAKAALGPAYLDVGMLYKAEGKTDQARKCISKAILIFEQCEAEGYLKLAKETLASLG